MKVWIVRQPIGYTKCNQIDVNCIKDIKWDFVSGGANIETKDDFLYGYIPYDMAVDLVDCSGLHKEYGSFAKICILKGKNIKNNCKSGYDYCVNQASNPKRKSFVSRTRPEGYPACTKQIIEILKQQKNGTLYRGELRKEIIEIGYPDTTFRSAVKRLGETGKIRTEGSSLSKNQKIILK